MRNSGRIELRAGLVLLAALPLAACMATVGAENRSIPPNSAAICEGHCQSIGMRLSAVAIMAENVGCVCQHASEPKASARPAGEISTPIAGMATIALQQAAAAAQTRRQQQQQHRGH